MERRGSSPGHTLTAAAPHTPPPPGAQGVGSQPLMALPASTSQPQSQTGTRVQVAVRVRPPSRDPDADHVVVRQIAGQTLSVDDCKRGRTFVFDHVFTGAQPEVFQELGVPMLTEAFEGFNVCLFAYGQTGSGKTYSIQGPSASTFSATPPKDLHQSLPPAAATKGPSQKAGTSPVEAAPGDGGASGAPKRTDARSTPSTPSCASPIDPLQFRFEAGLAPGDEGVLQRLVLALFGEAQRRVEEDSDLTIRVAMSYLEVYNEKVRDLLAPRPQRGQEPESLDLMEAGGGPHRGSHGKKIKVKGLGVHSVLSPERVWELLARGNANRQTAETRMNEVSSRSHGIVQLTVSQLHGSLDRRDLESVITVVDLAGSERQQKTESTGQQFEEAKKINQSLLSLGRALHAASEKERSSSTGAGFCDSGAAAAATGALRESKLTRLLAESFGGNDKTWMLATVAPTHYNLTETLSTLDYATYAKAITNKATVNSIARHLELAQLRQTVTELDRIATSQRDELTDADAAIAALEGEVRSLQQFLGAGLSDAADGFERSALGGPPNTGSLPSDEEMYNEMLASFPPAERAKVQRGTFDLVGSGASGAPKNSSHETDKKRKAPSQRADGSSDQLMRLVEAEEAVAAELQRCLATAEANPTTSALRSFRHSSDNAGGLDIHSANGSSTDAELFGFTAHRSNAKGQEVLNTSPPRLNRGTVGPSQFQRTTSDTQHPSGAGQGSGGKVGEQAPPTSGSAVSFTTTLLPASASVSSMVGFMSTRDQVSRLVASAKKAAGPSQCSPTSNSVKVSAGLFAGLPQHLPFVRTGVVYISLKECLRNGTARIEQCAVLPRVVGSMKNGHAEVREVSTEGTHALSDGEAELLAPAFVTVTARRVDRTGKPVIAPERTKVSPSSAPAEPKPCPGEENGGVSHRERAQTLVYDSTYDENAAAEAEAKAAVDEAKDRLRKQRQEAADAAGDNATGSDIKAAVLTAASALESKLEEQTEVVQASEETTAPSPVAVKDPFFWEVTVEGIDGLQSRPAPTEPSVAPSGDTHPAGGRGTAPLVPSPPKKEKPPSVAGGDCKPTAPSPHPTAAATAVASPPAVSSLLPPLRSVTLDLRCVTDEQQSVESGDVAPKLPGLRWRNLFYYRSLSEEALGFLEGQSAMALRIVASYGSYT